MGRPTRCRRVCVEPSCHRFAPQTGSDMDEVVLTVDEYEVIRLVDYEKRTHEQCAVQMDISRTTVTEIYESARFKLSDILVNGKFLSIAGGHYLVCSGDRERGCGKNCQWALQAKRGENIMRIAVPYERGQVFQHFGHTGQMKIYDIADGKIVQEQIADTTGTGHGALVGVLSGQKVDILICGGIGGGAQEALAQAGIKLYGGVTGSADEAVNALLAGKLHYSADVRCDHHGHERHAHCGEDKHGCPGSGSGCKESPDEEGTDGVSKLLPYMG